MVRPIHYKYSLIYAHASLSRLFADLDLLLNPGMSLADFISPSFRRGFLRDRDDSSHLVPVDGKAEF